MLLELSLAGFVVPGVAIWLLHGTTIVKVAKAAYYTDDLSKVVPLSNVTLHLLMILNYIAMAPFTTHLLFKPRVLVGSHIGVALINRFKDDSREVKCIRVSIANSK